MSGIRLKRMAYFRVDLRFLNGFLWLQVVATGQVDSRIIYGFLRCDHKPMNGTPPKGTVKKRLVTGEKQGTRNTRPVEDLIKPEISRAGD